MYGIGQNAFAPQQNVFAPQQNMLATPFAGFSQPQGLTGFGVGQQNGLSGFGLGQPQQGANAFGSLIMQLMQATSLLQEAMMQQQLSALASPSADFGGSGASGGSPGVNDFLGGGGGGGGGGRRGSGGGGGGGSVGGSSGSSGGGTPSVGGSDAPVATNSDFGKVPAWGAALARDAEKHGTGSGGLCFRYVRQALERAGVKGVGGASAYMGADQLARNPKFREVQVAEKDLPKLPAGAVVVWDRGNGHEHGHISIALGNGQEVSDVKRKQITGYGTKHRVFLPK